MRNAAIAVLSLSSSVLAEPVTIVALGDSLTAGYGLADQTDGLVPQLEGWLQAKGADVALQNAGVSGDTTAGGLSRLAWALGPEVDALIVTLGGNDLLRGLDPAGSRANLEGILKEATARGLPVLLVAMAAPTNFGPEYKAAFDAMYVELAAQYNAVLAEDFFAGLRTAGADPADPASLAAFMQTDGIHPNPEGVRLIVEGLGPKVEELIARVGS
ncbi:arylesterase [Tabrizicola sp.]|uniref:arylesterase n=1 Tax=Tabrizicola sp. TaxID=2005166 RepID=UPI00262F779B|nr:arylesterase [Tabrizicola sp.]MDM7933199.1 arylesterase [Tabrizicola sp.]